jgi:predicted CXXCH cytochrome family protein
MSRSFLIPLACLSIAAAPGLLGAPAYAAESVTYLGEPGLGFEDREAPLMRMPTAVAVCPDGRLAVADGVNDRVILFSPDGKVVDRLTRVGDEQLSRPLGVTADSAGRLWIADTGNGRIVVRAAGGGLDRVIPLHDGKHGPDPTDVVPVGAGNQAWIVQNDLDRLVRWDAAAQPAEYLAIGQRGTALGQFHYPFLAAADSKGRIFVSDSLNGRVAVISPEGKAAGSIGGYGVEPGQLYRPKGVAVDGTGNVWVADGVMGVIQVFEPGGRFLGVLRDGADKPLKFEAPTGIAMGAQSRLYVVELAANRVREVRITEKPRPRAVPGPSRARVVGGAGQAPACTVCHVEWMPAFAGGAATELMSLPPARPDWPMVSHSEMCLSCHDGSVMDSRRRVWLEHGHQTGIVPPPSIKVPDYLPLVDGKVACRTCHSAHAGGKQNQSLAEAIFVRVENGSGELCMSCHKDKTLGPAAGAHPVGGMPWAIPDKLVEAGAKAGPNPRELTCYVCHQPHGSKQDHLLVMGTESSQLCLTCHSKLRPGLWRPGPDKEHPQNPPLQNEAQRQAVKEMGTRTGPGETLICLSCHKIHHGRSGRYILADSLADSRLCLRCHPERSGMVNSSHDLRVSSPQCRNRIGQTAVESGPCGACHTFHRFARMPDPQPYDPTGLCASCHQAGQCAEKTDMRAPGHPFQAPADRLPADLKLKTLPAPQGTGRTIACLTCHNPHETGNRHFLVAPGEQLCSQCHKEPASTLSGKHELTGRSDIRNADGRTPDEAGKCGFCHTMHEAKGSYLWVATANGPTRADALCTNCHRADGIAAAKPETTYHHPTGAETAEAAAKLGTDLPLFDAQAHEAAGGQVACSSCHNPHADARQSPALLRGGGTTASDTCVRCHKQPANLAQGLHDMTARPAAWPEPSRQQRDLCLSCHQPHSNDEKHGLWTMPPRTEYAVEDGTCLGCHQHMEWGGHGTRPARAAGSQPAATQPVETAGDVHGLPLVPTAPGRRTGAIGCKTCHDPHAAPDRPHLLRTGRTEEPGAMCMACHTELQYIGLSLHGGVQMKEFAAGANPSASGPTLQCGPCHSVHPADNTSRPSAGPLSHLPVDVRRCVGCHSGQGGATPVRMIDHFGPLQNVAEPGTPGFMPLATEDGAIGSAGRIGCITCHAPHGRPPGPGFPRVDPSRLTTEELRAMMPMVRPYTAPNLCTSCHGFDGIMRFLYWHNPEKRGADPEQK